LSVLLFFTSSSYQYIEQKLYQKYIYIEQNIFFLASSSCQCIEQKLYQKNIYIKQKTVV